MVKWLYLQRYRTLSAGKQRRQLKQKYHLIPYIKLNDVKEQKKSEPIKDMDMSLVSFKYAESHTAIKCQG